MSTELAVVAENASKLVRAVANPAELISYHEEVSVLIRDALKDGVDYGAIPGTKGKTLLKPGAERLVIAFGCHARYLKVSEEIDHDRVNNYTNYRGTQSSTGLYRFSYKCQIVRNTDQSVIGECDGSCSTMEAKYVSRPRDCENTVIKMAQKRALVGAVLNAFGLSDRFTQDVEDSYDEKDSRGVNERGQRAGSAEARQEAPREQILIINSENETHRNWIHRALTKRGIQSSEILEKAFHGHPMTPNTADAIAERYKQYLKDKELSTTQMVDHSEVVEDVEPKKEES